MKVAAVNLQSHTGHPDERSRLEKNKWHGGCRQVRERMPCVKDHSGSAVVSFYSNRTNKLCMKYVTLSPVRNSCVALTLLLALPSLAQQTVVEETVEAPAAAPTTETTATTTMGTISEFGEQRIVVRTETAPEPLSYSFTKTTTYVDEAGAPVSIETVKSGLPVTIHYSKVGNALVANKVIVRKKTTTIPAGETRTTSTSTMGTISELAPEALVIRTETSDEPLRYKFTKTTTYVDEAGNPVAIKTVKSGLPVTVHYARVGEELVARKVIVRKTTTVPSVRPAPTTETRTETKTTTTLGTVNEFSPERIIIRTETSPDPLTYSFTKTTTYVDETGAPVSLELVKSGLPVTVHYTTEGDSRVATKVVVRKKTTTVVPR